MFFRRASLRYATTAFCIPPHTSPSNSPSPSWKPGPVFEQGTFSSIRIRAADPSVRNAQVRSDYCISCRRGPLSRKLRAFHDSSRTGCGTALLVLPLFSFLKEGLVCPRSASSTIVFHFVGKYCSRSVHLRRLVLLLSSFFRIVIQPTIRISKRFSL